MTVDEVCKIILYVCGGIITISGALSIIINKVVKKTIIKYSKETIDESFKTFTCSFDEDIKDLRDKLEEFIKQSNETDSKLRKATMRSVKDRLNQAHNYYMAKGYIGDHTMSILEELYSSYHELDGNDFIHNLMDDLRRLEKLSVDELIERLGREDKNNVSFRKNKGM
jgi:ElaB/YqjD/DUF883 family membrane-anchored ribosome-binding protein